MIPLTSSSKRGSFVIFIAYVQAWNWAIFLAINTKCSSSRSFLGPGLNPSKAMFSITKMVSEQSLYSGTLPATPNTTRGHHLSPFTEHLLDSSNCWKHGTTLV
uniref:(northern house mosquito) hypothetical protein n=1 Tax=Culex pipiens TaxID=7175 RepID=A0A8D8H4P8_CULPI